MILLWHSTVLESSNFTERQLGSQWRESLDQSEMTYVIERLLRLSPRPPLRDGRGNWSFQVRRQQISLVLTVLGGLRSGSPQNVQFDRVRFGKERLVVDLVRGPQADGMMRPDRVVEIDVAIEDLPFFLDVVELVDVGFTAHGAVPALDLFLHRGFSDGPHIVLYLIPARV